MVENNIESLVEIKSKIYVVRQVQVIIDRDIASLYGVSTKRLNEQVKRNIKRFSENFCFQLSEFEKNELVANCDRFDKLKYSTSLPYAFTEAGVAMLSAIINSEVAVKMSIQIINTFIYLRNIINSNSLFIGKLENLENKNLRFQIETEDKFKKIFSLLDGTSIKKKQGIFYDGQIFDSYVFILDLIKSARKELILIDNYVDYKTLELFNKRNENVNVIIYTKMDSNLKFDLEKYNLQYKSLIVVKEFNLSHDILTALNIRTMFSF